MNEQRRTQDARRDEIRRRIRDAIAASDAYETDAQVERARRAEALANVIADAIAR